MQVILDGESTWKVLERKVWLCVVVCCARPDEQTGLSIYEYSDLYGGFQESPFISVGDVRLL